METRNNIKRIDDYAWDIIQLQAEVEYLREEVEDLEWYKEKYFEMIQQNTESTGRMVSTVLGSLFNQIEANEKVVEKLKE